MDDSEQVFESSMILAGRTHNADRAGTPLQETRHWLGQWWIWAGNVVHGKADIVPQTAWETFHVFGMICLPDTVSGVDIRPLKRFVRAINAIYSPGPDFGPKPSQAKLFELSSDAREAYYALNIIPDVNPSERTYTDDAIPKGLLCDALGIKDDEFQKRITECPELIHPSHNKRARNVRFDVDALINTELYNPSLRAAAILKWKKKSTSKR